MTLKELAGIRGFFFDLDGVLVQNGETIPGAIRILEILRKKGIPFRILTNRTTRSLESLHGYLQERAFPVEKKEIFSPSQAAVHFLRHKGSPSCRLFMREEPGKDFSEFPTNDPSPDYVIIGDMNDKWNFEILKRIFNMIMNGAELVALHKGRYWRESGEFQLDIGLFVAGLEYVTGKKAHVMGKPSPEFFQMALEDIGLSPGEVAMLGDDIESDVGGAQRSGLKGVLCLSGKYRRDHDFHIQVEPDLTLDSIADLEEHIG